MKMIIKLIVIFVALCSISQIKTDSVCTESILVMELIQDIKDNGKLDCLRHPLPPPTDRQETEADKKLRLEGAWDTDCSFEADYDWMKPLRQRFGLRSGLVDKDGKSVETDFDDQADMCEIFRALIAGGIIEGVKLDELNESVIDGIDCPGEGEEGQSEICAVSGGSAGQNYSWYILLEGISMTANERPQWEMQAKSKDNLEIKKISI